MLDLAVNGYSYDEVRNRLHMQDGSRIVSFRYELIGSGDVVKNPDLWVQPGGTLTLDTQAEIQRTAQLTLRDDPSIDWQNDRVKIWFRLRMRDGGYAEWPLGVFYMPTAPETYQGGIKMRSVECYDASLVLQGDAITSRLYYQGGSRYTDAVLDVVLSAGITRIMLEDATDALRTDKEWEPFVSKSAIVADLLAEVNYTALTPDGEGVFRAARYVPDILRTPDYTYAAGQYSVVFEGGTKRLDAFDIPNVFVGVVSNPEVGEMHYIHENTTSTDPISIHSRNGRRVVEKHMFNDIASMDVLQQAVLRRADEASRAYETIEFETALMPHHEAGDCLLLQSRNADGRYIERSWEMQLQPGGRMRHSAERLVAL